MSSKSIVGRWLVFRFDGKLVRALFSFFLSTTLLTSCGFMTETVTQKSVSPLLTPCPSNGVASAPCQAEAGNAISNIFGNDITSWLNGSGTPTITAPIPNGFYANQDVSFTDPNLLPGNIANGVSIFGVMGSAVGIPAACSSNGLQSVNCTASNGTYWTNVLGANVNGVNGNLVTTVPAGYYDGTTTVTASDSDLIAANILDTVTIFGVTGNLIPAYPVCSENVLTIGQCSAPASRYITATAGNNVNGTNGSLSATIPLGFQDGTKTCTMSDSSLIAANIKSGTTVFGIPGSFTGTMINITPLTIALNLGATQTFVGSGGTAPYTYTLTATSGDSINSSTGFYTAPTSLLGNRTVKVTDNNGYTAYAAVDVTYPGPTSVDQVTGASMRLHWPTVPGGQYKIYNTTSGTTLVTTITNPATSQYTVTGLTPATNYSFRVRLVDILGTESSNTNDINQSTLSVSATFMGWAHVKAVGNTVIAAAATDMSGATGGVTLSWEAVTLSSGSPDSYNIYRATSPGGFDFNNPLATGINSTTRTYTDSTVSGLTDYYYAVRPVVGAASIAVTPTNDYEIKLRAAPDNMALVHRWAANREMCVLMGKTPDRANDYRCSYTGLGNVSNYYDMTASYFVDRFEMGCNYTVGNNCGGSTCVRRSVPTGITANENTIYYDRAGGRCYINTSAGSGTTWTEANNAGLTPTQRALLASNRKGLPPLVYIDQVRSQDTCQAITVGGDPKRLMRRKEQIAAAAWQSTDQLNATLADGTTAVINNVEDGSVSHAVGTAKFYCNSSNANGVSAEFQDVDVPTNLETIAWQSTNNYRAFRTGSNSTRNCQSAYGLQDLVGNVWEWTSDQCAFAGNTCNAPGSPLDANATDLYTWNVTGLASNYFYQLADYFLPTLGLPWISGNNDGTVAKTAWSNIHNDHFWIANSATRGLLFGGNWDNGAQSGRFTLYLIFAPSFASLDVGSRCVVPAE